jgi:twitching motility protein PilT
MEIMDCLHFVIQNKASDLFVTADKVPHARTLNKVVPISSDAVSEASINAFRQKVLLPAAEKSYQENGSFDAGLTLEDGLRFRINFLMQQGKPAFVARPVPSGDDLSFEALNLPLAMKAFADSARGLFLIAGAAGSGKSTTMAAMVNHINNNYSKHIVTIEDPIEFVHNDKNCFITQREVGADTASFSEALKNVVRESPDVILIGEMRDLDTMQTAITAALTGHLVISTIHTADTIQAVERIINHFPEHLRQQAADDLSLALIGVAAQRLLPSRKGGLIPVNEILKATPLARNLIAQRNFRELENTIRRGQEDGMINFNRALSELYKSKKISIEEGAAISTNREEFLLLADGMESGIETFRGEFASEANSGDDEINMKRLLHSAVANGASDLILTVGSRPCVRFQGEINELASEPLSPGDTKKLLYSIINQRQRADFEESRELDFALTVNMKRTDKKETEAHRFRVNAFYQRGNIAIAIRVINQAIPPPESLGIPPAVVSMADKKQGLILVTGPTGHGKSTTMASLVDRINKKRACHIITIEDPIEYVHPNKKAVVEQREVHADTLSFSSALKYVLRQDPDVILVGEMRDTETIASALTAAETGHLVMATLHTNDAPQSVDRIIDSFPAHQQNQIRLQLSSALLGIISQRLLPKRDSSGRVAAFEILAGTHGAKALIREGKTHQLRSVMETGAREGMITMEKALTELYNRNIISRETMESYLVMSKRVD